MKLLVFVFLAAIIAGCGMQAREVGRQTQSYEVLFINPPKRMYVDLRNTRTGEIVQVYVAKRCSSWRRLKVGSRHALTEATYAYEDGRRVRRVLGARALCPDR